MRFDFDNNSTAQHVSATFSQYKSAQMTSTTDNGNGTVRYFYITEKRDTKQMHKTNELKHRSAVNTLASHTCALYSCEKHAQPTAGIMNRKFAP